jgi:hypothetical protein
MISWEKLESMIIEIKETTTSSETAKIYKTLTQLVKEFNLSYIIRDQDDFKVSNLKST